MRPGPNAEERLSALTEGWAEAGDRRGAFAQCYLVMTKRALPPGSRREASAHLGTRASTVATVILLGRHPGHRAEGYPSGVAHVPMPEPAPDGMRISLPE